MSTGEHGQLNVTRAGVFVNQPGDYRAFIPRPLPPRPPLDMDGELIRLLSDADRALGWLDGVTTISPNPDLFVGMYVRQEALVSSQIEGTQSTLEDVLQFEAGASESAPADVGEVINYVRALNFGLGRLADLPLSLRLIREIHAELLRGGRGAGRAPGEFRRSQNWIGPAGAGLQEAAFVPPPPHEMNQALHDLEKFLHDRPGFPPLLQCGLAHAQFETIHPFLDGNGRVGRLLITFLLCERQVLRRPFLYLSVYLKRHRAEYYDRLMGIRLSGDWEGWLKFFLRGIEEVSREAAESAVSILALRDEHRRLIQNRLGSGSGNALRLFDHLFQNPLISPRDAEQFLGCAYATANTLLAVLEQLGILEEKTGRYRNRRFRYSPYLALFKTA